MSETNHLVLDSRYEMYLENKRVERCQELRQNALKRLASGELEIQTELQPAFAARSMNNRKRFGDYFD